MSIDERLSRLEKKVDLLFKIILTRPLGQGHFYSNLYELYDLKEDTGAIIDVFDLSTTKARAEDESESAYLYRLMQDLLAKVGANPKRRQHERPIEGNYS